ncbi:hypothetical protein [Streptomyces sp. NPDC026673]|uniref:hypothetical protein n=1 Tax=Streptomyces sp. NPDC026673 TaxID=3155724 RepID=UPI0033FCA267
MAALRGRRPGTVPSRLRLLRGVLFATAAGLAGILATGGVTLSASWSDIRDHSAPQVTSATGLYFTLNDMDAQLANRLMPGAQRAEASTLYDQRRAEAAGHLRELAEATEDDPAAERDVAEAITDLGAYEELAARALLLSEQGRRPTAVATYNSASDLMRTRLLPEADRLVIVNDAAFERTYQESSDAQSVVRKAFLLTGLFLLALLALLQVYLLSRFRRVINPGAAAASALMLVVLVTGLVEISGQREQLRIARHDAFDSVVALTRARAVSYDANADESRYLLDRAGAAGHERHFLAKSQQLMHLPGATISTYDADLTAALGRYRSDTADLPFTGYFGDEFRNITFAGERSAAERVLAAYQIYQRDDRTIRALATAGKLSEAVAFCTSHAPGNSNYAFDQYDKALGELIAINVAAYEDASAKGADRALTTYLGLAGAALAAAGLAALGLRPRLAEFR